MGLISKKILGISVTTDSKKTILEYLQKYLKEVSSVKCQVSKKNRMPLVIVTPNPEQIVLSQADKHFAEILNQADVAIPDGIGLVVASRLLNDSSVKRQASSVKGKIPGVELMEDLVKIAAKEGYGIGLIGGRGAVAVKALECLQTRYPGLRGWAQEPGEFHLGNLGDLSHLGDVNKAVEKIRSTGTRIVFVGLGASKQEYFIERMVRWSDGQMVQKKVKPSSHPAIQPLVFMAVGGSFDIIAGRTPRAPHVMQAVHLEWLWRLVREPWRWRRQVALIKFLWLVLREKLARQDDYSRS